ncbi:MAG: hypothetical protein ACRYFA_08170 [Janthinobacterium lividum]
MSLTLLQNPQLRYKQYVDAINFYLAETNKKILFVENSGIDLSSNFIDYIKDGRLEILAFNGNDYDRKLGKGYGEMLIIEYATKNSMFFMNSDFVIKITGRLKILNIKAILKQWDNIIPTTSIFVNLQKSLAYADSRCWAASKDFYVDFLLKYKSSVDDSINFHFENALTKATHLAISKDYKFSFLNTLPRYSGISGTKNEKYENSFIYWFPLYIKHKVRLNVTKK